MVTQNTKNSSRKTPEKLSIKHTHLTLCIQNKPLIYTVDTFQLKVLGVGKPKLVHFLK